MRAAALLLATALSLSGADLYFPPADDAQWERIPPSEAGWDEQALEAALDFAEQRRSSAVVILLNGRVLAERTWDPGDKKSHPGYGYLRARDGQIVEDVASAQKSVTAELFGIAQAKGLVDIDDPVAEHLGEGWSKAAPGQEARITLRHLLTMTSGLTDRLGYQNEPGERWRYNTPAYQRLMRVMAEASGKTENELTREWLTSKIGMSHTRWRQRPAMPGMIGLATTAWDLARFGLLMLNEGDWDGERILPDVDYVRASVRPSQDKNKAYGYLWWLNGYPVTRTAGGTSPTLIPSAPKDLYAAQGAGQRKVYVVPSMGLVVTRTGDNGQLRGESSFNNELWRLLIKAAPQ